MRFRDAERRMPRAVPRLREKRGRWHRECLSIRRLEQERGASFAEFGDDLRGTRGARGEGENHEAGDAPMSLVGVPFNNLVEGRKAPELAQWSGFSLPCLHLRGAA